MSDSSDSGSPLLNGPESTFVVDAVDALLRRDVAGARVALLEGADAVGWEAVAHRLDVAGRALAIDAGLSTGEDDVVVLLPELDTSDWIAGDTADAALLLSRWSSGGSGAAELPIDAVWPALRVVAWLVDRAGYPAQVVV